MPRTRRTAGPRAFAASPEEYLTAPEAARRANVATETVHRWIARGMLRAVRVGARYRIDAADFARVLVDGRSLAPR